MLAPVTAAFSVEGAVDPLAYWIGFNKVRGIGPARLRALLDAFGSVEAAWLAPAAPPRGRA